MITYDEKLKIIMDMIDDPAIPSQEVISKAKEVFGRLDIEIVARINASITARIMEQHP